MDLQEGSDRVFHMQVERNWTDGFKVVERDFAVLFGFGDRNVNNKCDVQVVRDGEISAGDIVDVEASGANQVWVGGKVDVLGEAKAVE